MLILKKNDLESLLTMEETLDALETGFREMKEGQCVVPVRFHLNVEEYQGQFLFMPGFLPGLKQSGTKVVSVFPQNTSKGKPTIFATYLLSDPTTGEFLALIEGGTLTGIRTGGASGLATRYLAKKTQRFLGSSEQVFSHSSSFKPSGQSGPSKRSGLMISIPSDWNFFVRN